jgi:hypothetical protein
VVTVQLLQGGEVIARDRRREACFVRGQQAVCVDALQWSGAVRHGQLRRSRDPDGIKRSFF